MHDRLYITTYFTSSDNIFSSSYYKKVHLSSWHRPSSTQAKERELSNIGLSIMTSLVYRGHKYQQQTQTLIQSEYYPLTYRHEHYNSRKIEASSLIKPTICYRDVN